MLPAVSFLRTERGGRGLAFFSSSTPPPPPPALTTRCSENKEGRREHWHQTRQSWCRGQEEVPVFSKSRWKRCLGLAVWGLQEDSRCGGWGRGPGPEGSGPNWREAGTRCKLCRATETGSAIGQALDLRDGGQEKDDPARRVMGRADVGLKHPAPVLRRKGQRLKHDLKKMMSTHEAFLSLFLSHFSSETPWVCGARAWSLSPRPYNTSL